MTLAVTFVWFKQYLFDISHHKYTQYKFRVWKQEHLFRGKSGDFIQFIFVVVCTQAFEIGP